MVPWQALVNTMELFEQFLAAENAFFAYFGYYPARSCYPERHPILDFRTHHWLLVGNDKPIALFHSAEALSGLNLEIGRGIFADVILEGLGVNFKSGSNGGVWRGPVYTLIATGLPDDGSPRYLFFSNANECRDPFLARQALAQIQV
jgi:hypothetical protein